MALSAELRRSWVGRQVGTLALAHVRLPNETSVVRAAAWHNVLAGMGVYLPLFVVHDLGVMLTASRGPGGWRIGPDVEALGRIAAPPDGRAALDRYAELLDRLAQSEVIEKAAGWRLRDDLVGVLIMRILGEVWNRWTYPAKAAGARTLPLEPGLYAGADVALHFRDFDATPIWGFVDHLGRLGWHIYTCLEQTDLDTLKLLGLFREGNGKGGDDTSSALALPDLFQALRSADANDVVNFSLELLPSILETKRAAGAQIFSMDGYASIERRGNPDSLVLSEFAYPEDLFDRKVVDQELYYYGHEQQRDEERRLQYILVDSSASMRGQRQVFARGLALTLAKKLVLEGDEVWIRFFDSRLYETTKVGRSGAANIPYLLSFRSERGRNYGKVFRQLLLELTRIKRESRRRVVLYLITHGQCHVPVELVAPLKRLAYLYGIVILPSSEVELEWVPLFDQHQIVSAQVLDNRDERRDAALNIIKGTG